MTKKELQTMTVAELKGLAKKSRVEIKARLKADIIDELSKGLKKTAKTKKAAPAKKKAAAPKKKTSAKPAPKSEKKPAVRKTPKKAAPSKPKPEPEKKPEKPSPERPRQKQVELPRHEPKARISHDRTEVPLIGRRKELDIYPLQPVTGTGAIKGANSINAIAVEPGKAFLYWKVAPESMTEIPGEVFIRVYEITGVAIPLHSINFSNAHMYYDIVVTDLTGSRYLNVTPGREYFVDIGIKGPAGFTTLGRSQKVATPIPGPAKPKEGEAGEGLPEEHFKFRPEGFYD